MYHHDAAGADAPVRLQFGGNWYFQVVSIDDSVRL